MFCHGFILTYRTIIRPSSPAPSPSTCGSSSSHQTGEWPQNATSTVLRSLVALISPYPKEPARGQFSAGTTSPVMLTTVRSVVSPGQVIKSTLFYPPDCFYTLQCCYCYYRVIIFVCYCSVIYYTSFIHEIILQIVYYYTHLYYHVSLSAVVVPIILTFVYHSHKCHFPVIFSRSLYILSSSYKCYYC